MDRKDIYKIIVVLEEKLLFLYKNDKLIKEYPVGIGKEETPTPKGTFKIKNKDHKPPERFGAKWLGIDAPGGSYGIHGTLFPSTIGQMASDGCIRMYNEDVIEIYNLVPIGSTIVII